MSENQRSASPNGSGQGHRGGFGGGPGFGRPVQKAKDFKGTLKRLIGYLKPHRVNLAIVLIFAILSTVFTIASPKVTGKAMTKLQEGYMSGKMLTEMAKGQEVAVEQIYDKMAEAQIEAVDQISNSMAEAQSKAIDQMYGSMADQVYTGIVDGQKTAVNQIVKQMAAAQKGILTQLQMQMQQVQQNPGAAQQMDAETLKAIQDLMQLPSIDASRDKIGTTIKFIDIMKRIPTMPGNQQMSSTSLESLKRLLALPMLDKVTNPDEKTKVVKDFMELSKSIPGGSSQQSSMQFDEETMDRIYERIPGAKYVSKTRPSENEMDDETLDAVKKLIDLPILSSIIDPKEKLDNTLKLVDIFKEMPEMEKNTAAEEAIDPKSLDVIKELLQLPLLGQLANPQEKAQVLEQMLDIFSRMPDMGTTDTSTANTSEDRKMDPESINAIKDFIALPRLATLTDANQKADVVSQILDLGKDMQSAMDNTAENPKDEINLTEEQIDNVIIAIRETNGKIDMKYIGQIAMILLGMYLISSLFSLIMGLVMSGVSQKTVRDLRSQVDKKLSKLPLKYFDMHAHGDILSRVTNDVDTISTTLQQSLTQLITSIVQLIGYIVMMLTISPLLTLIVLATLPLYIFSTVFVAKRSQQYFAAQQKELGLLSGHVEEMYTGHKVVKVFGHEADAIEKFSGINDKLYESGWKAQFISGIMFPLMNFVSNFGYVLICIVGGIWMTKGRLNLGDITAFIQYSRSFTQPIVQTANIANVIQSTVACAERVFEILDETEELPDSPTAQEIEQPKGEVTFEHVDFRYKEEVPLIENMNLDVRQGHTIAIVGPTGAGKTTLVNLLMRFYEINGGKISIDGIDIKDIQRGALRGMFGMVLQDTWLFNGTIRDNIAYGRKDATEEEIIRAAKAAHADRFIRTLPEGYNTVLNEEATNISQGQKQLLTIARAILANPTILILDEATSSVDTRTEVLIQKAMANLMENRTSFVIAHRLSTIRDAELILVMNQGSIIEQGNHKELLAKGGFYADLYNSQFAGSTLEEKAV